MSSSLGSTHIRRETSRKAYPPPDNLGHQFVVLGDGASVHYSGPHGDRCYRRWQRKQLNEAEQGISDGAST